MDNFLFNYPESSKFEEIKIKLETMKQTLQNDKFKEINDKVESAFNALQKKKGTKSFQKDKDDFIKKWEAKKNNKGSEKALEYVEKARILK